MNDMFDHVATVTEGWRTLDLFTDRFNYIRRFLSFLNDDLASKRILYLYGDGGNGKSLLLRVLREHYCLYLTRENWSWVKQTAKNDEEIVKTIKEAGGVKVVPSVLHDFGMSPEGDERPHETFLGLLMIRRALAGSGLAFPLFSFACVWYLHKMGRLSRERMVNLFPSEEMDFLTAVAELIWEKPWFISLNVLLKLVGKNLKEKATLYASRRKLSESEVSDIQRMEPRAELINELPRLFAQDLNVALSQSIAHRRVVLFFDAHEALWGHQRNLPSLLFFGRDEWVRRLIGCLDPLAGVRVVVAGREPPRWPKASKFPLPAKSLDVKLVRDLPRSYADLYLRRTGIISKEMRRCISEFTQVVPGQSHPLYLGLCADVVLAAQAAGVAITPEEFRGAPDTTTKGELLTDKLLSYADAEVSYSVRALSACRAFNRTVFVELGKELNFQATVPAFDVLTQFSFVWRAQKRGQGWYRIHDLLRRLFHERGDETTRLADQALEKLYRRLGEGGETTSVAEAIYHTNRLDWRRGAQEWAETFERAIEKGDHSLCRALFELRGDLLVKGNDLAGRTAIVVADYLTGLARYDEALDSYSAGITAYLSHLKKFPEDYTARYGLGLARTKLGDVYAELAREEEAVRNYRKAIADYDEVISLRSEHFDAYCSKAWALMSLGDLRARYETASRDYKEAVKACEEAQRLAPRYIDPYINKGSALSSLGEWQYHVSRYEEAISSLRKAVKAFDEALSLDPHNSTALNNKSLTLVSLGEVQTELCLFDEAVLSYEQALEACERALRTADADIVIYSNKGAALDAQAKLFAMLSRYPEAENAYRQAVDVYDAALRVAPDYVVARANKGAALTLLGELYCDLSRSQDAVRCFNSAIDIFTDLQSTPSHAIPAHSELGTAYFGLGRAAALTGGKEAENYYRKAVDAYDTALKLAPHNAVLLDNKAHLYGWMADSCGNYANAVEYYNLAITTCQEALIMAPNDLTIQLHLGQAFSDLGLAQVAKEQYKDAADSLKKAISVFSEALRKAPSDLVAHINKGHALHAIGEIYQETAMYAKARESYEQAVAAYEEGVSLAPNEVNARAGKADSYRSIGELCYSLAEYDGAIENLGRAIETYEELTRSEPGDYYRYNEEAYALIILGDVYKDLCEYAQAVRAYERALRLCDKALEHPYLAAAYINRGAALNALGDLQIELSDYEGAIDALTRAVAAEDEAAKIEPDDHLALVNKGESYSYLGIAYTWLERYEEALANFELALKLCSEVLNRGHKSLSAYRTKGDTLQSLGELKSELSLYEEARDCFSQALEVYDEALGSTPDHVNILNEKGKALLNRAKAETQLAQPEMSLKTLAEANAAFDRAITNAPSDVNAHFNKGETLLRTGEIQISLKNPAAAVNALRSSVEEFARSAAIAPLDTEGTELRDRAALILNELLA